MAYGIAFEAVVAEGAVTRLLADLVAVTGEPPRAVDGVITRLSLRQSATGPADPLWTGATVYARSAIGAEPPLARVAHWHAPKLSLRSLAAHLTGGAALRPHHLTRKVVGHMSLPQAVNTTTADTYPRIISAIRCTSSDTLSRSNPRPISTLLCSGSY